MSSPLTSWADANQSGDARDDVESDSRGHLFGALKELLAELSEHAWQHVEIEVRAVTAERLWAALPGATQCVWSGAGEEECIGLGDAARFTASGPGRMQEIRREGAAYLASGYVPEGVQRARLFGGFAFAPNGGDVEPWGEFGDACFLMPRWLYRSDGKRAWLRLTWDAAVAEDEARFEQEAGALQAVFEAAEEPSGKLSVAPLTQVEHLDPEVWHGQVEAIRDAISAGAFHKIVAARHSTVTCDAPLHPQHVLSRLASRHEACRRFAFAFGPDTCFVGATPERLVRLEDGAVQSEALAGSIPVGEAEGLLESAKDALEHRLVVNDVVAALEPYCESVDYKSTPRLKRLRDVAHMETPIRGTLRQDAHVLDLVEALHPTSAVGGVPQRGAQEWIVAHETARGWYSGPVGWFDSAGEGDFAVALRCGVLRGRRAYLFAGAGVVGESEPALEYEETRWKMLTLMRALGVQEQA